MGKFRRRSISVVEIVRARVYVYILPLFPLFRITLLVTTLAQNVLGHFSKLFSVLAGGICFSFIGILLAANIMPDRIPAHTFRKSE